MPELRMDTMTVNMGPQPPSTHGVLRLVLELDGEIVRSVAPTIGFLHTGIEKTAKQKNATTFFGVLDEPIRLQVADVNVAVLVIFAISSMSVFFGL